MQRDAQSWQSTADEVAGRSPALTGQPFAWLAEPAAIFALIGVYLLGHLALRLALSPTLGIDDAEQILFAQEWAPGYRFRQPPLFTWMLLPIVDLLGPGVLAISLVRYALLAVTYICLYLTACLCLDDRRMAGLCVLSFTLIYAFAYYAHHDLTHTTALGAMIALAFYVITRLAANPSWLAYLVAGLVFGLGMLAKWNFAMLAIGVPLTCLVIPSLRHLVLTRKILATLGVMAAVVTPTALWMVAHGQTFEGVSGGILGQKGTALEIAVFFEGSGALARSIALFPLPFLPIFLLLFGQSLAVGSRTPSPPARFPLPPAFFGWLTLIVLGLHALLIPTFGAVNFTERWLHPALMSLPIFLFALAERGRPSGRRIAAFLVVVAILVAASAGARLYRYAAGADACDRCREFAPFADLAEGLRKAGFFRGTIVADGMHIGGNLKMLFADSRVIDPAFPRALWPDADERAEPGACLLVWRDDGDDSGTRRDRIRDYAVRELDLPKSALSEGGRLDAALMGSSTRRFALGFELYRGETGGCR